MIFLSKRNGSKSLLTDRIFDHVLIYVRIFGTLMSTTAHKHLNKIKGALRTILQGSEILSWFFWAKEMPVKGPWLTAFLSMYWCIIDPEVYTCSTTSIKSGNLPNTILKGLRSFHDFIELKKLVWKAPSWPHFCDFNNLLTTSLSYQ